MGYKMAHSAFLDLMTTPVQNRSYEKQCFESGPIWNSVVLTGYNSIFTRSKSSFYKILQRVARAIFLQKNSSIHDKICERYLQNTERSIYSASPVILRNLTIQNVYLNPNALRKINKRSRKSFPFSNLSYKHCAFRLYLTSLILENMKVREKISLPITNDCQIGYKHFLGENRII